MHTFPVTEIAGRLVEFGVYSAYISIGQIVELLSRVPEVEHVRRRRPFSSSADVHVSFNFKGVPFNVLEPFGDNDRYWIGPEDVNNSDVDAAPLRKAFEDYTPSLLRKLFGNLVTLSFLKKDSS